MTFIELSMAVFIILNVARAAAYFPQIHCIWRDQHGASSVSLLTWSLFTAANIATAVHAIAASGDRIVASVFLFNAACCFAIVVLAVLKRSRHSRKISEFAEPVPALDSIVIKGAPRWVACCKSRDPGPKPWYKLPSAGRTHLSCSAKR
jgi:hypothetical protein